VKENERIGLVEIYTDKGKGKTTAALGLALRAAGHGMWTYVIQFMKGREYCGELGTVESLDGAITIKQMGREAFVDKSNPAPEDIELARATLSLASEVVLTGKYNIVILDEINMALDFGLIDIDGVIDIIDRKPAHVELILTGRNEPTSSPRWWR